LALNGALLLLAGLLAGAAIPAAPYPRLMLAAHCAGFTDSGLISMLAALLLSTSLCSVSPRAGSVIVWSHVTLWPLSLSEVAAAFWGTKETLRIAGAQAGAPVPDRRAPTCRRDRRGGTVAGLRRAAATGELALTERMLHRRRRPADGRLVPQRPSRPRWSHWRQDMPMLSGISGRAKHSPPTGAVEPTAHHL